ncbi:L-aspartate oxidase [Alkalihalobacillus sp. AL-G]|uniref:L-aspartate oxidase n=1 Tax=Alkalihalobacillus sp. AL-G TaxID=2926399 RepID=UPI00272990FC|nr:L-aspartate oxidase [Alkalihalobacillus sp. AL-G]WLD94273.1 L-aspartate oxidase [Alkalihalobacillus sp. AL-G]
MNIRKTDVLILGSGLSGLMSAQLLSSEKNVIVLTKNRLEDSNSYLAQGGIAAAVQADDSWYSHFLDSIQAGCHHNNKSTTKALVREGPAMIEKLIEFGVGFDRDSDGHYQFGREGAHSLSRILHVGGDSTGKHVIEVLKKTISEKDLVIEGETAIKLIIQNDRCLGVWSLNDNGEMTANLASAVVIATGGYSGLYPLNSNASTITGDGVALAYEAGTSVSDMEFIQFHPTLLMKNGLGIGLVSEAVRGKGAVLIDENGEALMDGQHPMKDLAPRDIVARVLYRTRQCGKQTFLDIRNVQDFPQKFPTITQLCEKNGVSLEKGIIPIAPGAHFTMGGIDVDGFGKSTLNGLYAVGEAANTGVHGANRLASNSLLEGLVFANRLAGNLLKEPSRRLPAELEWSGMEILKESPSHAHLREIMNKYIGIERNIDGLKKAAEIFNQLLQYTKRIEVPSLEQVQLRNQVLTGWIVATSALQRTESRGSHYRTDFPEKDDRQWKQRRIIRRKLEHESIKSSSGA